MKPAYIKIRGRAYKVSWISDTEAYVLRGKYRASRFSFDGKVFRPIILITA